MALLSFVIAVGCSTTTSRQPPQPSAVSVADAEISSRVSRAFFEAQLPAAHLIEIDVSNGTVILTAHAEAKAGLDDAAELARGVDGVKEVVVRTEVR